MPQQVCPNIYKIEVPIPNNPLKALNAYVITGASRPLVIDVGLNRPECVEVLKQELAELDINPEGADFFITHMHADHSGAIGALAGRTSQVYAGVEDAEIINRMATTSEDWNRMKKYAVCCGFPETIANQAIQNHPGFKYGNARQVEFTLVDDGDMIAAGNYYFRCIKTPGHTQSHMCLYEPQRRILVAGDHILPGITPNISTWSDRENPLAAYLKSLNKVAAYEVDLLLPGHRWGNVDCSLRVKQLRQHHEERSRDVLNILRLSGDLTPYEVASRMRWDLSYQSWEQFPAAQQWFAAGEAVAHLQYLESTGEVERGTSEAGQVIYQIRQ